MTYHVFDLHCDTADMLALGHLSDELAPLARTIVGAEELSRDTFSTWRGQLSRPLIGDTPWVQCLACFIPDPLDPATATRFCTEVFDHVDEECADASSGLVGVRSASDIRAALSGGKTVGVKTIENARLFASDPALVHAMAERGVIMASLSWNGAGPLASGHDDEGSGLTKLGAEVLGLMEDERMILDVSHLNDVSFDEVAARVTRPFVATHSNSRAICAHPRGLTDAQFAEIRDRGGIVGLNFANEFIVDEGQATFDDFSRHIEHWLDMGGEDVLALGSDFDGTKTPEFVADASRVPSMLKSMEERFGAEVTSKIASGNALSFFERYAR